MWYLALHATYLSICPVLNPRGAPANGGRPPVRQCLSRAALPDRAGQRVGRRGAAHCAPSRGQRPNRAPCRARFHYPGRGVSAARARTAPHHARALGGSGSPATAGLVAPESAALRPPPQSVDVRVSGRGQLGPRPHGPAGQPRSDPHGRAPLGGELAAGQALAYQSRSGVCPPKKARDRLSRWAASHPAWALGCEEETWWSGVAQPARQAWTPAHQPLRVVEQTVPPTAPEPKALAC